MIERSKYYQLDTGAGRNPERLFYPPLPKDGGEFPAWAFSKGERLNEIPDLVLPIYQDGANVSFCITSWCLPLISSKTADVFRKLAGPDLQLFRIGVEDGGELYIPNICSLIDCFDRDHSEFTESQGRINMVLKLVINEDKVIGHNFFRIRGWNLPFMVSSKVVIELRRAGISDFAEIPVLSVGSIS